MQRRIPVKISLVSKDIHRKGRVMNHVAEFGTSSDRNLQPGRYAKHDRVAMCLLRKEFDSCMPVRREHLIVRNRRRLKIVFAFCILWWLVGRFFL